MGGRHVSKLWVDALLDGSKRYYFVCVEGERDRKQTPKTGYCLFASCNEYDDSNSSYHSYTNHYSLAGVDLHPHLDNNVHPLGNVDLYAIANLHIHSNSHTDPDPHTYRHPNCNPDADPDFHPLRHSDLHSNTDSNVTRQIYLLLRGIRLLPGLILVPSRLSPDQVLHLAHHRSWTS